MLNFWAAVHFSGPVTIPVRRKEAPVVRRSYVHGEAPWRGAPMSVEGYSQLRGGPVVKPRGGAPWRGEPEVALYNHTFSDKAMAVRPR